MSRVLLAACTSAPKKNLALEQVRSQLEELQSDEDLAGYAPLALGEAERALRQAEAATNDTQRIHLIYMADLRIQIARAMAQREQLEEEYIRALNHAAALATTTRPKRLCPGAGGRGERPHLWNEGCRLTVLPRLASAPSSTNRMVSDIVSIPLTPLSAELSYPGMSSSSTVIPITGRDNARRRASQNE